MSFSQSVTFTVEGRRFYILVGKEILPGTKTHIGFAVKHNSATSNNFDYHKLALERLDSGKYKYPLSISQGSCFRFLHQQQALAKKILAWLESEGAIHRPGSVKDVLRRGETLANYAPEIGSEGFEATMSRSKYVIWRTQATGLVERLPVGDERRTSLEGFLARLPGLTATQLCETLFENSRVRLHLVDLFGDMPFALPLEAEAEVEAGPVSQADQLIV